MHLIKRKNCSPVKVVRYANLFLYVVNKTVYLSTRYEYYHTRYSELFYLPDYIQFYSTWRTRHRGILFVRSDMYLSYLLG